MNKKKTIKFEFPRARLKQLSVLSFSKKKIRFKFFFDQLLATTRVNSSKMG